MAKLPGRANRAAIRRSNNAKSAAGQARLNAIHPDWFPHLTPAQLYAVQLRTANEAHAALRARTNLAKKGIGKGRRR